MPKDETILFVSAMDGRSRLWKTSLKKKERGRFEPHPADLEGVSRSLQLDRKGEALYYTDRRTDRASGFGRGKNARPSPSTRRSMVDKTADYEQMLGELYYILANIIITTTAPQGRLARRIRALPPVLQQVREDQDFADYANLMIGEFNSSHIGFSMPRTVRIDEPSAHVGAVWSFEGGKTTFVRLIKDGPLYVRARPGRPRRRASGRGRRGRWTRPSISGNISTEKSTNGSN